MMFIALVQTQTLIYPFKHEKIEQLLDSEGL